MKIPFRRLGIFVYCLFLVLETNAFAKPSPGAAGVLSIVPGLGQFANGDHLEGASWFITTVGLYFGPKDKSLRQIGYDLWLYNTYDAYRDAGARGAARHNVFENYIAAFNPLNIIDPIGAILVGSAALTNGKSKRIPGVPSKKIVRPFIYGFVALGEEGLFRGFLFPGLSDVFSSKFMGALSSSILFAYFHFTNGPGDLKADALLSRTLLGLLWCWQTNMNNNDLRKSIFSHTWFDFFVDRNGGVKNTSAAIGYKIKF